MTMITLADIASVVSVALVVLLHVRLSGLIKRVNEMQRTGVLIEDDKSAKRKQIRLSSPRQRLQFIERAINSGVNIER